MIVLGLDPGTATTGYGVIEVTGTSMRHIAHGAILTPANTPLPDRLLSIAQQLRQIIAQYQPDRVGIEELFFYKNVTTAIAVAQARGVLVQVSAEAQLPVGGYTPLEVKQAVTSFGRADKQQIQKMVMLVLGLTAVPKPDDAADGLAIAITCAQATKLETILS